MKESTKNKHVPKLRQISGIRQQKKRKKVEKRKKNLIGSLKRMLKLEVTPFTIPPHIPSFNKKADSMNDLAKIFIKQKKCWNQA